MIHFWIGTGVFVVVMSLAIWRLNLSYERMLQVLFEQASKSRNWEDESPSR